MNYSLFGAIRELESEQASGSASVRPCRNCGVLTLFASKERRFAHSDVRKSSLNVLLYMKELHTNVCILYVLIMYLNNVLSCCRAYTL